MVRDQPTLAPTRTVIALMTTTLLLVIFVAVVTLGPGAAWTREGSEWGAVVTGLLVVVGLATGFWALQVAAVRRPWPAPVARPDLVGRAFARVELVGQRIAGTVLLGIVTLTDLPRFDEFAGSPRNVVRALLWAGLMVSVLTVARSTAHADPISAQRWRRARVLVPFATLTLTLVLTTVLGSAAVGRQLLAEPLALLTATALVVVPSSLILAATEDLGVNHARGERLWLIVERRPWSVLVLVGINLVIAAVLILLSNLGLMQPVGFSPNVFAWSIAVVVTWFLIMVLTLDSRIALTAGDQRLLGRIVVALVAVPTGLLILGFIGYQFLAVSLLSVPTLATLVGAAAIVTIAARMVPQHPFGIRWLAAGAAVLGAAGSLVALLEFDYLFIPDVAEPTVGVLTLVFFGGLVAGLVITVVLVILARRFRVIGLLALLVVWTFLAVFLGVSTATGTGVLNLDLMLMLGLSAMAGLWLVGRQHTVDGFEIALTVVVTTTLWLVPVGLRLVPDAYSTWLLAVAFATPGGLSCWSAVQYLRHRRPDAEVVRGLGVTCLSYALVGALAWYLGAQAAAVGDNLSNLILDIVLMPLALLLILAASAARRRAAAPPVAPPPVWGPPTGPPPVWFPPPPPDARPAGLAGPPEPSPGS